jgi:hypothetical protein
MREKYTEVTDKDFAFGAVTIGFTRQKRGTKQQGNSLPFQGNFGQEQGNFIRERLALEGGIPTKIPTNV